MKLKNLFLMSAVLISCNAFAADGQLKGSVGYGLDMGFQPVIPFGLGLQALFYNSSYDVTGGRVGIKRAEVMAKVTYNMGGESLLTKYSYVGAKFGVLFTTPYFDNGTVTNGNNYTRFGIAPAIGFDAPFAGDRDQWTAGIDLSYLFVVGPETNQDTFQALAAIKYWF
jgi:hypothetical protein